MINAIQAGFFLDNLTLMSTNRKELTNFYNKIFDIEFEIKKNLSISKENKRKIIIIDGKKNKFVNVGFSCSDLNNLIKFKTHVTSKQIEILEFENNYLDNSFSIQDFDGNVISFGVSKYGKYNHSSSFKGYLQHITFSTLDVKKFKKFYVNLLGFKLTDSIQNKSGDIVTCFVTSSHHHHTIACFKAKKIGLDHYSYEVGDWNFIKEWCDFFSKKNISIKWGPGRHGPGHNLFIFVEDSDQNWIELSAELEIIHKRKPKKWPHDEKTLNLWGNAIMRS